MSQQLTEEQELAILVQEIVDRYPMTKTHEVDNLWQAMGQTFSGVQVSHFQACQLNNLADRCKDIVDIVEIVADQHEKLDVSELVAYFNALELTIASVRGLTSELLDDEYKFLPTDTPRT